MLLRNCAATGELYQGPSQAKSWYERRPVGVERETLKTAAPAAHVTGAAAATFEFKWQPQRNDSPP
jgi:hypothetical protein